MCIGYSNRWTRYIGGDQAGRGYKIMDHDDWSGLYLYFDGALGYLA